MNTMFMISENRKSYDLHRLVLNLSDKINLKRSDKYVALSNLSFYFIGKNLKSCEKEFKTVPTWNDQFELPVGS